MKIIAVHLLNDFSGSPRVLRQLVKGWIRHRQSVTIACNEGHGLLSDIQGVTYEKFRYRWHPKPLLRLRNLLMSQWYLFWVVLRTANRSDIVYINTVLPFAAAWAGKLRGCRIVYHLHETSVRPPALKAFLFGVMRALADDVIYVSNYLAVSEPVKYADTHLLPNALDQQFLECASGYEKNATLSKNILMVCSLKGYKGVNEFVTLAAMHPELHFQLVLNALQSEIDRYFHTQKLSTNLNVFSVQEDLHPFYRGADVILNLSRPDQWIETFGLTILEGMAYGLPALVPPVGGITELAQHGQSGYHVDSRDIQRVSQLLSALLKPESYASMSSAANRNAHSYSEVIFIHKSLQILGLHDMDSHSIKWNQPSKNPKK